MQTNKWDLAADMLAEAGKTIRERAALRDFDDKPDTIAEASLICGLPVKRVLDVQIATKQARFERAGDYDSAVDLLAYQARKLCEWVEVNPAPEPPLSVMQLIKRAEQDDDVGLSAA